MKDGALAKGELILGKLGAFRIGTGARMCLFSWFCDISRGDIEDVVVVMYYRLRFLVSLLVYGCSHRHQLLNMTEAEKIKADEIGKLWRMWRMWQKRGVRVLVCATFICVCVFLQLCFLVLCLY